MNRREFGKLGGSTVMTLILLPYDKKCISPVISARSGHRWQFKTSGTWAGKVILERSDGND